MNIIINSGSKMRQRITKHYGSRSWKRNYNPTKNGYALWFEKLEEKLLGLHKSVIIGNQYTLGIIPVFPYAPNATFPI